MPRVRSTPDGKTEHRTPEPLDPHDTHLIRVVGLDPSFRNWGYAFGTYDLRTEGLVVQRVHLVTTERSTLKTVRRSSDDFRSATELRQALMHELHGFVPHIVFSEIPQGSQSAVASRGLGISLGVLASAPYQIVQVQPSEVKFELTGSKQASKQLMMDTAYGLFPQAEGWLTRKDKGQTVLLKSMEHTADAIGAIVAGTKTAEFQQLVQLVRGMRP